MLQAGLVQITVHRPVAVVQAEVLPAAVVPAAVQVVVLQVVVPAAVQVTEDKTHKQYSCVFKQTINTKS